MDKSSNKEVGAEGYQTRQIYKKFQIVYLDLGNGKGVPAMVARDNCTEDGLVVVTVEGGTKGQEKQKLYKVDPKIISSSAKVKDPGLPFCKDRCQACRAKGTFFALNAMCFQCTSCARKCCTGPLQKLDEPFLKKATCCGQRMKMIGFAVWCDKCQSVAPNVITAKKLINAKRLYQKHRQCALTLVKMSGDTGVRKAKHGLTKINRVYLNDQSRRLREEISKV